MVEAGYILASFPELLFDIDSVIPDQYNVKEFLLSTEGILSINDACYVRTAVEDPAESSLEIAKEWQNFVVSVQNETAKHRWTKVKSGVFPQIKGAEVSIEAIKMATQISQSETPLQAQLTIFSTLWNKLEFLDACYQNSIENIIIYAWKLQVLTNLVQFKKELGKKTWGQLVNNITKKAGFSPTAISEGGIENEY